MASPSSHTHVLLLVEDNPADADLVEELLAQTQGGESYVIVRAARLADALERLKQHAVDVCLLDLRLPDGAGLECVQQIRNANKQIPIVVLTGTDNDALAMSCIKAGAQDYLCKNEIRPNSLRRSIGYAISRIREAQLREITETLARFRMLSSQTSQTSVTAALAGTGAVRERYPAAFTELIHSYRILIDSYCEKLASRKDKPREAMERVVTALGDAGGGPRDLLDVHIAALDELVASGIGSGISTLLVEARLLALEMMGLLVDYYRVGARKQRSGRARE